MNNLPDIRPEMLEQAAIWRARLAERGHDQAVQRGFEMWLQRHPNHLIALERVSCAWKLLAEVADTPEVTSIRAQALTLAARSDKRTPRHKMAWVAFAYLFGIVLVVVSAFRVAVPVQQENFRTALNERRAFMLNDGSKISLDVNSALSVSFYRNRRELALTQGQARFEVAKDKSRPFTVTAKAYSVTATGTDFTVRLDGSRMTTTLLTGRVVVADSAPSLNWMFPGSGRKLIDLEPGQQFRVLPGGHLSVKSDVSMEEALAWESGRLVFNRTDLAEAVESMNHYSQKKISLGSPILASFKVSGVFKAGDAEDFVNAISELLPVAYVDQPDGQYRLLPR